MPAEVADITLMTDQTGLGEARSNKSGEPLALVIERAGAGDLAAFEQIMDLYQRKVFSTAWRMLGNEEDARDASQEVFLRLFKYLNRFRQGEEFSGWLYRIVVNVCRDIARKRGGAARTTSYEQERELGGLDEIAGTDDVEASAILTQEQAIIARALETLSKKEREALVLRDLEGLPTGDVARILGSTQTTVRSQIASARAKIKLYRERVLSRRRRG